MSKGKEITLITLKLFVICLISALLLAGTNMLTSDKIAQAQKKAKQESLLAIFPELTPGEAQTVDADGVLVECTPMLSGEDVCGYVFSCSSRGYGGDVSALTGIDLDGRVVKTVILSAADETPGLGQNATKPDFLDRFTGTDAPLSWVKADAGKNEIQGVTSATYTSKAVIACVNASRVAFEKIAKGAK